MEARADFPEQLETERLHIAIYEKGDEAAFYHILQENAAYLEEEMYEVDALRSIEDAEAYVSEMIQAWHKAKRFVPQIIERASGEMIGQLWIEPRWEKDLFEIGYFIVEKKQGQGLVAEAVNKTIEILFNKMRAKSLEIHTKATNTRSIKLAERCGFTYSHKVKDEEAIEMLYYRLLKSEHATKR